MKLFSPLTALALGMGLGMGMGAALFCLPAEAMAEPRYLEPRYFEPQDEAPELRPSLTENRQENLMGPPRLVWWRDGYGKAYLVDPDALGPPAACPCPPGMKKLPAYCRFDVWYGYDGRPGLTSGL